MNEVLGVFDFLDARAVANHFQRVLQPLDAADHRAVVALRLIVLEAGDGVFAQELPRAVAFHLQFHELRLRVGQLGLGLGDFFGPVPSLQLQQALLGGVQGRRGPPAIGLVVGIFQLRQHLTLLHPHSFREVEVKDHADDLGTDQDLVFGNDVAARLQHDVRGAGRLGGASGPGGRGDNQGRARKTGAGADVLRKISGPAIANAAADSRHNVHAKRQRNELARSLVARDASTSAVPARWDFTGQDNSVGSMRSLSL